MHHVLHAPVLAHGSIQSACIGGQASDVEAILQAGLGRDGALRGNHHERTQLGPALGRIQTVDLLEGIAAAHFESAVALLDRRVEAVGVLCGARWKSAQNCSMDSASLGWLSLTARM